MDREAGPPVVEGNIRHRVPEEIVQVAMAEEGRAPEFARTKAYVRPRRRPRNIRLRRARFTFAYCLLSFVLIALLYHIVKFYLMTNDERLTSEPVKTEKTCSSLAKNTYDERKDIHSHTSFSHDGYCYFILQVDTENFTNCIAEGFVLSHFIQRGNKARKYLFNKVKQLGHGDKYIHIGAFIECRYCMADMRDYVCNGCIINEMVLKFVDRINITRQYKCPQKPKYPTPWDGSRHGLQFEPVCVSGSRAKRMVSFEEFEGDEFNYGVFINGGQFKYIKEGTINSSEAWYLCERKL